jgi:hypothetical protein
MLLNETKPHFDTSAKMPMALLRCPAPCGCDRVHGTAGRLSNNAAERAMRGIAVGRRNWTFAGSDVGGHRAAALYTLIETCKLNEADRRAWLADVLARLPEHPAKRLDELLPWNWKAPRNQQAAA